MPKVASQRISAYRLDEAYTRVPAEVRAGRRKANALLKKYGVRMHPLADSCLPASFIEYYSKDPSPVPSPDLYNSPVFVAVRYWNSPIGVPESVWNLIVSSNVVCCEQAMSRSAYRLHEDSYCLLMPQDETIWVEEHALADGQIPEDLQKYIINKGELSTFSIDDHSGTVVANALNAWNSGKGIPIMDWIMVSTAYIKCETCKLCRSFDGDQSHRNIMGGCKGSNGPLVERELSVEQVERELSVEQVERELSVEHDLSVER